MTTFKLIAEVREEQGRGASRRLRHAGKVPAIVYGSGKEATAVVLDHKTVFYALQKEAFHTSILELEINGKTEKVILRDFHNHPYKQLVLHLDLQRVSADEEIHMSIPLHFLNEDSCHAVKAQGAHVTHVVNDVEVRALPANIPSHIDVDLAKLSAGQTIHLSDLVLPKNVTLEKLLRGDDAVVVIAGGIAEVADAEIVSPSDVPSEKGSAKE